MTNTSPPRIPLAELARLYPNTLPVIVQDPERSHSKWVDWAYVKGRAALKPCKALRVREKIETKIRPQEEVVPFRQEYQSATNGRNPKPRKKIQPEQQLIICDSIENEAEEEDYVEMYGPPPDFSTSFCMPSQSSQPEPSRKRKLCEEQGSRKRMRGTHEDQSQGQMPVTDETFHHDLLESDDEIVEQPVSIDEEAMQETSQIDEEAEQEALRTLEEEALEKSLAGHTPDYSFIIDKEEGDASSFIDSEEEVASDNEDSCVKKIVPEKEPEKKPEKKPEKPDEGYDTERIPTPEWEDLMERHSQEWNSPEARARRNSVLARWAWEDQNGLFFGKPYGNLGRALYPDSQDIPTFEGGRSKRKPPIIAHEQVDHGAEADDEEDSNEVDCSASLHSAVADRYRGDTEPL